MRPAGLQSFAVVKLGGSLLDRPQLASRLTRWLDSQSWPSVLVVGGGVAVDWLRRLAQVHNFSEELAHWLAIELMRWNARWLTEILPNAALVSQWESCGSAWREQRLPVLDPVPFCRQDAELADNLPMGWLVTSDSIAAQLAWRWQAAELVLLKSCSRPAGDWYDLAIGGYVDRYFPEVARRLPQIRWATLPP